MASQTPRINTSASPLQPFQPQPSSSRAQSPATAAPRVPKKRGRKPKNAAASATASPVIASDGGPHVRWATPTGRAEEEEGEDREEGSSNRAGSVVPAAPPGSYAPGSMGPPAPVAPMTGMRGEDADDADDDMLPAMADDDYSEQLRWQSQSKDNLKVLMDNLSAEQYDRFEAYRRHALPKQAIRKVIQQTTGQQVSAPLAQIIAGVAKVFVGEMVERARAVQERQGESGPLSPDHLRQAYRIYQSETGRVGAARPLRSKKLFVR